MQPGQPVHEANPRNVAIPTKASPRSTREYLLDFVTHRVTGSR
jgi:hypothetical protein